MLTERHYKNEDAIKSLIVTGHRNGICDSNGASVKVDGGYIAKPILFSSSVKTYVYRKGKMVLKNG